MSSYPTFQLGRGRARGGRGRAPPPEKPAGPPRRHDAKTWTAEEQAVKLRDYIEVKDQDRWSKIRVGTHVRYYTRDGLFRTGGFVQVSSVSYTSDSDGKEKKGLRLQTGFYPNAENYFSWTVTFDEVSRLFVKLDTGTSIIYESTRAATAQLNTNISKLVAHLQSLEGRIAALEASRGAPRGDASRSRSVDGARHA